MVLSRIRAQGRWDGQNQCVVCEVSFVVNLLCTFASAAPPGVGCGGAFRVPPITIRPPQGDPRD
jgi:hypothetical protein